jgi:hypothetical protein
MTHVIVASLAVALAISALYMASETKRFNTVFYGPSYHLTIPPNSNMTIHLAVVSDTDIAGSLLVKPDWTSPSQALSIERPGSYDVEMSMNMPVTVNGSAFLLLEDSTSNVNATVDSFVANSVSSYTHFGTFGSTLESSIELNHHYQLKIGNYETFALNQTGPVKFTIQPTNRTLEVMIAGYTIPITFASNWNLYVTAGLLILNVVLITAYSITFRKSKNTS